MNHDDTTDTTAFREALGRVDYIDVKPDTLAEKLRPLVKASQAKDYANLLHVANNVALIEVPQVMTKAGAAVAEEIEALLSSCVEKVRAAAMKLNQTKR